MSATILDFYRGQRILRPLRVHQNTVLRLAARGVKLAGPLDAFFKKAEGQEPSAA